MDSGKPPFDTGRSLIFILMIFLFTIGLTELGSQYNILLLLKNFQLTIGFYAAMVTYFVTSITITYAGKKFPDNPKIN